MIEKNLPVLPEYLDNQEEKKLHIKGTSL